MPDTLILPCNRPDLEQIAKKVIGSERTTGTDFNDINTQYGNWTIVILSGWETKDDRFMLMSSEANEQLNVPKALHPFRSRKRKAPRP